MHPIVALSSLFENDASIIPITHVRKIDYENIEKILKNLPGVNLEFISCKKDQGDVIYLRFLDQNERVKTMSAFMNPIVVDDVKSVLDSDIFVFLPVTDFEIALSTLKFVKQNSEGQIIFDAHGLTKVMTSLGDRLSKFWIDRDLWLPYIDILKMNLKEAGYCWFKKNYSMEDLEESKALDRSELAKFAMHCFRFGLEALYITLDAEGCLVFSMEKNELVETLVPAVFVNNIVDSTGCGDSFAGGLVYGLLTTDYNYIKAAEYANTLGAQCLQGSNFEGFKSREETEKIVKDVYYPDRED